MSLEEPGKLQGVLVLARDAQLERLQAADQQERRERIGAPAKVLLLRVHFAHERHRAGGHARDQV